MEDQPIGRSLSIQPLSEKDRVYELFLQKDKDFDNMFSKLHHLSSKECVSLVNNYRSKRNDFVARIIEKQRKIHSRKESSKNAKEAIQNLKDAIEDLNLDVKAKNAALNAYIEHRNLTKQYLDYLLQYKADSEKILKDRSSEQQKQLNEIKAKIEQFEQKLGLRILLYQGFLWFTLLSILFVLVFVFKILENANTKISVFSFEKFAVMPGGDSKPKKAPWEVWPRQVLETLNDFRSYKSGRNNQNLRFLTTNFNISPGQGNLMFIFAALYAQSRRLNYTLLLPDGFLLRRSFYLRDRTGDKNRSIIISSRLAIYLMKKWPKTIFHQCCRHEKSMVDNLTSDRDQSILGYFQSYKYFEEFGDDVKNQFEFLEPIKILAKQAIDRALESKSRRRNDTILIGVHVRRGFDLTWNTRNQIHGHVIAPKGYFLRAMSHFRSIFNTRDNISRTLFLITSDDPFWCRQNLLADRVENDAISRDTVLVANPANMREVDLAILASCQHTVMSTGTFSWWAAYLAGGQAIYYENWPRPGSSLSKMVQRDDYFLPRWIPIV